MLSRKIGLIAALLNKIKGYNCSSYKIRKFHELRISKVNSDSSACVENAVGPDIVFTAYPQG